MDFLNDTERAMENTLSQTELLALIAGKLDLLYNVLVDNDGLTPAYYCNSFFDMLKIIILLQTDCDASRQVREAFRIYANCAGIEAKNEAKYWEY